MPNEGEGFSKGGGAQEQIKAIEADIRGRILALYQVAAHEAQETENMGKVALLFRDVRVALNAISVDAEKYAKEAEKREGLHEKPGIDGEGI